MEHQCILFDDVHYDDLCFMCFNTIRLTIVMIFKGKKENEMQKNRQQKKNQIENLCELRRDSVETYERRESEMACREMKSG